MSIKESCTNWTIDYQGPELSNIDEVDLVLLKYILHVSGDALSILSTFNTEPDLRRQVLSAMYWIWGNTKNELIGLIDSVMDMKAWTVPLEGKFAADHLFGEDLRESLLDLVDSDEIEKSIVLNTFPGTWDLDPFDGMEEPPPENEE